ncbi:TonB family protein [Altererythrobacter sp. GH1-8]|uniref:TonB family protein n=1 Tax=Altererythrobacter sp. GH1-8 TaxID=3349333 RepID=UPI00374CDA5A
MAYADAQSLQQRSAGIAGAALAHVAIGGIIVVGLSVSQVIGPIIDTGPMPAREWKEIPPPPPPDPKPDPIDNKPVSQQPVVVPDPPVSFATDTPIRWTTPDIPPPGPIERIIPSPRPGTGAGFGAIEPVAAIPRGDPSRWITDSDYKSRWIREGFSGRASFSLQISKQGRVEKCSITRSTGHSVLDQATCALITKRARFEPARSSDGSATSGIYTSAIHWQLPD